MNKTALLVTILTTSLIPSGILKAESAGGGKTNLTFSADVAARVGFDSNVYLQDKEPDLTLVPQAVLPFQESFFVGVTPRVGLDYVPCSEFNASVSYAPDVVFYTEEPSENHVSHRAILNLKGKVQEVPWEFPNTFTYVQGSDQGLYFGASTIPPVLDGAPSIGGIPTRDRRQQFVYRGRFVATWSLEKWFFRPVVCAYYHDFQTDQKRDRGYENYIDRRELCMGGDVGYSVAANTRLFTGFRFGYEIQGQLLDSPYHYDAEYYRPIFGIEGQPASWIKANFSIGPDIHHTIEDTPPEFAPNYTTLWVDGVVTLLPTARDAIVLTWRQNTQPAFASTSVYDDIVYEIACRHTFNDRWWAGAGFKAYNGDWFAPVQRDDWIYTPSARVGYRYNEHLTAELTYSYDWTESAIPNTEGRDYTRQLVWLSAQYRF